MSPNGRRRFRKMNRRFRQRGPAKVRERARQTNGGKARKMNLAQWWGRDPLPLPPKPFTPRSLVGMTQGARKRAAWYEALRAPSGLAASNCRRHGQNSQASARASSQSKHGPLIVRGSLAMFDPPREPARLDVQYLGQLRDSLKTRLAAPLFPLAHVATCLWRVKRCSDCGLRHLPILAGSAESVG